MIQSSEEPTTASIRRLPLVSDGRFTIQFANLPAGAVVPQLRSKLGAERFPVEFQLPDSAAGHLNKRVTPVSMHFADASFWDVLVSLSNKLNVGMITGYNPVPLRHEAPSSLNAVDTKGPLAIFADVETDDQQRELHLGAYYIEGEADHSDIRFDDVETRSPVGRWMPTGLPRQRADPHGCTVRWVYNINKSKSITGVRGRVAAIVGKEFFDIYVKPTTMAIDDDSGFRVSASAIQSGPEIDLGHEKIRPDPPQNRLFWFDVDLKWKVDLTDADKAGFEYYQLSYPTVTQQYERIKHLKTIEDRAGLFQFISASSWSEAGKRWQAKWETEWGWGVHGYRLDGPTGTGKIVFYSTDRSELEKWYRIRLVRRGFLGERFEIRLTEGVRAAARGSTPSISRINASLSKAP